MNNSDKKVRNIGLAVLLLMLITSVLLKGDVVSEPSPNRDGSGSYFSDMQLQSGSSSESGDLDEGGSSEIIIAEDGMVIKNMTVSLSWQDESDPPGRPRLRRYENQPDSFSVTISSPDGNSTQESGSNSIGSAGALEARVSLQDSVLNQMMDAGTAGNGNWTIEISLVSTGMWTPVFGPGLIVLTDNGNEYSVSIEYEFYDITPEEES